MQCSKAQGEGCSSSIIPGRLIMNPDLHFNKVPQPDVIHIRLRSTSLCKQEIDISSMYVLMCKVTMGSQNFKKGT